MKPAGRFAHIPGCWCAYVAAGATADERARRLADCPTEFRPDVESHVRTVCAIRAQARARSAS